MMSKKTPLKAGLSLSQKWICAVATAVLWWAAGLPVALFALGWAAFVPLFLLCSRLPAGQRLKWGWITGTLSYLLINWWVVLSVTRGAPAIGASALSGFLLGAVGVLLIGVVHGLGVGVIALLWRRKMQASLKVLLLWPLLLAGIWWGMEWLRGQSVLGHTWGALAYTQWGDLYSLQVVSIIGRNGLSAWCLWLAVMFALAWRLRQSRQIRQMRWALGTAVAGLAALHLWGAVLYYQPVAAAKSPLKVLLVQTAVPGISKTEAANDEAFEQAKELTQKYFSDSSADLVVWPETTFSLDRGDAASMKSEAWVREFCRKHQVALLSGTKHWNINGRLLNDATLFSPDGSTQGNAKKWLVPFGERAPFGEIWPSLNRLAPQPPITPETKKVPLQLQAAGQSIKLGTLICFESSFAAPFHYLHERGAQLLIVLTNDVWFAGSEAPWAHAAMSAVAAVENRTPVLQAANGGYSFLVDRKGRFVAKSTFGVPQALAVDVRVNQN